MSNPLLRDAERQLVDIFRKAATKHEANERAAPVMEQLTRSPGFLSAVLEKYVSTPGMLDRKNYPVVGIDIAQNAYFGLVANCWIPLPDGRTDLSTKMIHHHGDMLLTTATLFGPGYEHWMFSLPKELPGETDLFSMKLLEAAPHPKHHVSFVDAWTCHVPLYPKSLSITLALWSARFPTTWRDRAKRLRVFRGREERLRRLAMRLGLRKQLQLKVVEAFDYYPEGGAFRVMRDRKEFELGPNEHHVASVFHVLQQTGNERLGRVARRAIEDRKVTTGRYAVESCCRLLEQGKPIEGQLSDGHTNLPFSNFTRVEIERALRAAEKAQTTTNGEANHGRKLAAEATGQATAGSSHR